MLKLYKTTIIASSLVAVVALTISIICEGWIFPHTMLIQNYAVGITCSLVVVIITTLLQYLHEHDRVFTTYCGALRTVVFHLSIAFQGYDEGCSYSRDFYQSRAKELSKAFEEVQEIHNTLCWFSPEKRLLQESVYMYCGQLWISFEQHRFDSPRVSLAALKKHPKFSGLVKACIEIFPDGLFKDYFEEEYKDLLRE